MRAILSVFLAVDCLQVALGLVAFQRGRRSYRAGAPSQGRLSVSHAALLVGGALVLAVPALLGLFGGVSSTFALIVSVALEAVALVGSRRAVKGLEAAHLARRPGLPLAG